MDAEKLHARIVRRRGGAIAARSGRGGAACEPRAAAQAVLRSSRCARNGRRLCRHARRQADPHALGPAGGRAGQGDRRPSGGGMASAKGNHRSPDHAADALCQQRGSIRGRSGRCSLPTTSRNICNPIFCSIAPGTRKRWSRARRGIGIPCCSGQRTPSVPISSWPKASCMSASLTPRSKPPARHFPVIPGRSPPCMW